MSMLRKATESELKFFKKNKNVGGMISQSGDDSYVINPYSKLSEKEKKAVGTNEMARLYINKNNLPLNFKLTDEQKNNLSKTSYKDSSDKNKKATILGRIISGDPSGGTPTFKQKEIVKKIKKGMFKK